MQGDLGVRLLLEFLLSTSLGLLLSDGRPHPYRQLEPHHHAQTSAWLLFQVSARLMPPGAQGHQRS